MHASKSAFNAFDHYFNQQQSTDLVSSHLTIICPLAAVISCLTAGHDARHSHSRSSSKGQLHSHPILHSPLSGNAHKLPYDTAHAGLAGS